MSIDTQPSPGMEALGLASSRPREAPATSAGPKRSTLPPLQPHRIQGIQGYRRPRLDGAWIGVLAVGQGRELSPDLHSPCSKRRSQPRTVSHDGAGFAVDRVSLA